MERWIQLIVDGLGTGAIYASLALALVLIFRSTGIVNLAQGEMAMFSTFIAWQMLQWGWPVWLAILATLGISFLIGSVIERVIVRPVEGASELTILIVTLGLFVVVNGLAGWIWEYLIKSFPSPFPGSAFNAGPIRLGVLSVGTLGVLLAEVVFLYALFQRTKVGLAMRAVASNPESSRLVGIRVGRMLTLGWGLAATIGAIAGVFVAPRLFLEPNMMFGVLIFAFAAAILGGFDSPPGAVVGGLLIGVIENVGAQWLGADMKLAIALLVIFAVLIVRPTGLFGRKEVVRV